MPYRFDRFAFSRDRGLSCAGQEVPLEPQALELLGYLLENRARVVARDEINDLIWQGRIVSDAALSTLVRTLRRALGDDRTQQKFIRTHPKRGFEFVADVEQIDDDEAAAAPQQPRRAAFRPGSVLAALAVFVALAVGIVWWRDDPSSGFAEARPLSIVVLPFDNLSGDPELDYLADAFTDDLITDLSRIRDAFVISRSTTFTYRGKTADAVAIARELGVRYVLEGSLRVSGDRVRINAQLIDGETDSHVWSDRFDRELADLFSVQDNVTGRIASVLRAELRVADNERQGPEATRDAWDYALRGNVVLYDRSSIADYQEAHTLLTKAVALDPKISSAWSGLAFVHYVASQADIPGVSEPNSKGLSLEAARKSVETDPKNAEGYWLLGVGFARNGQPERGMPACEAAMDLNPNMDCGYVCAGLVNMAMGRPEAAVPLFEYALRLNPRFRPFTKQKFLGVAHIQSGQDEAAIHALNRALAGAPRDLFANLALTSALALADRSKEASKALARSLDLAPGDATTLAALRDNYGWLGPDFERVLEGLQMAGLTG